MSRAQRRLDRDRPERSLDARLAVLAGTAVADVALVLEAGAALTALATFALVAVGHRVSWRGLDMPRTRMGQAVIGAVLAGCVVYLLLDLFGAVFGGALPQAKFALAAQAATAFDLKSRRNLFTHIWHSLAILYIAALFAWDVTFLPFVLLWGVALCGFLVATRRAAGVALPRRARTRPRIPRRLTGPLAAWLLVSVVLFTVLPRFPGRPLAVPLLVSLPATASARGEALPAALPLLGAPPTGAEGGINLRARGRLGDEVVMRVRSGAPNYWRAYALEEYGHSQWVRVDRNDGHLVRTIPPVDRSIVPRGEPRQLTAQLSQTIFIERPIGSAVPAAYPLHEIYFPGHSLTVTDTGTVESPFELTKGVDYAVVSDVKDSSPQALRAAPPVSRRDAINPVDLSLPGDLPHRVVVLADQVTAGRTTEYDRLQALIDHLSSNYAYSLDAPRVPAGADAVDRFLFVDRVGFCEQFASALAVMARHVGIPARVAVGYAVGERDGFTGVYTVRNRDAHAWVEAYFPGHGWLPFDASPGFDRTPAAHPPTGSFLGDVTLDVGSLSASGGAALGVLIAAVAGPGVVAVAVLWYRSRRGLSPEVRRYLGTQRRLRLAGLPPRSAHQTVAEHLAVVRARAPDVAAALTPIAGAVERAAFGTTSGPVATGGPSLRTALARHRRAHPRRGSALMAVAGPICGLVTVTPSGMRRAVRAAIMRTYGRRS